MSTPYRKSTICRNFSNGTCTRRNCPFAHIKEETILSPSSKASLNFNKMLQTLLKLVFEKQEGNIFFPDTGMLDISALRKCSDLSSVVSTIDFNTTSFCNVLAETIAETVGSRLKFLCINENEIRSFTYIVNSLKKYDLCQYVEGLSAKDNNIDRLEFASLLGQFPRLKEIVMCGNPVTNHAEYAATVRKRLPNLAMVDMSEVQRVHLSLPWPLRGTTTTSPETGDSALAFVQSLLAELGSNGLDGAIEFFHPMSCFSFSVGTKKDVVQNEGIQVQGSLAVKKDFLKDTVTLRTYQTDRDHNLMTGIHTDRIARGRIDVMKFLSSVVYPSAFAVEHILEGCADVSLFSAPVSIAIVAVHGEMCFHHKATQTTIRRFFDRTMTLVFDAHAKGSWQVSNDLLHLRAHTEAPLFFPDAPTHILRISKQFGIAEVVARAAQSICSPNDSAYAEVLRELSFFSLEVLESIGSAINTNEQSTILNVARLMHRKSLEDPLRAVAALQSASMHFEDALNLL